MYSETSCRGGQSNHGWMHAFPGNCGTPKLRRLCLNSRAEDCRLGSLWELITLFVGVISSLELSKFSVSVLLWMEFSPHNLFSDTRFGSPNIHVVRIQLSLNSMLWELRPLSVSAVHGWAGVGGHHAESLSRLSLLRFSLLSFHSSFDRAWTCRSYFRIWKHWSKQTTWSIWS
jgi:hypothetical protein